MKRSCLACGHSLSDHCDRSWSRCWIKGCKCVEFDYGPLAPGQIPTAKHAIQLRARQREATWHAMYPKGMWKVSWAKFRSGTVHLVLSHHHKPNYNGHYYKAKILMELSNDPLARVKVGLADPGYSYYSNGHAFTTPVAAEKFFTKKKEQFGL